MVALRLHKGDKTTISVCSRPFTITAVQGTNRTIVMELDKSTLEMA